MVKAYVEIRSQHSVGLSRGFGGPDTYVAVQVVPDGVEPLKCLNAMVAAKRGIKIIYCGEGYASRQSTERSMLGAAKAKASRIADRINDRAESDMLVNLQLQVSGRAELPTIGEEVSRA